MVEVSVTVKNGVQDLNVVTEISSTFGSRSVFQVDTIALHTSSPQCVSKFTSRKTRKARTSALCCVLIRDISKGYAYTSAVKKQRRWLLRGRNCIWHQFRNETQSVGGCWSMGRDGFGKRICTFWILQTRFCVSLFDVAGIPLKYILRKLVLPGAKLNLVFGHLVFYGASQIT